jgi:serine protease Do
MERMIIKHISGSKANQVEEFPLHHYNELVLGREESATVKYDPDRDDLVGRQHAKVSRDPNDETGFLIEDLNSRNGTFINKQRLQGVHKLHPGDAIQLGPGGPEFVFDIEPRPQGLTKPTRVVEVAALGKMTPATRAVDADKGDGFSQSVPTTPTMKTQVGKATVERMISHTVNETKKSEGKKFAKIGGGAALAVLLLFGIVIGGVYWNSARQAAATQAELNRQKAAVDDKAKELEAQSAALKNQIAEDKANAPLAAEEISANNEKSVVFIQGSWQLQNKVSQTQIYHQFIPNNMEYLVSLFPDLKQAFKSESEYKGKPIVDNGAKSLPVYVKANNGTQSGIEPYLTDKHNDLSEPIGSPGYTCSGFLVTTDGYILTNRHCSAPWLAQYTFPQDYPPGILIGLDGKIAGLTQAPPDWIPDNTKGGPRQYQGQFEGNQKLTVMLPKTDNPIQAQRIRESPRHDIAMIKINIPGSLPKVELFDNYDGLKKGEGLVIMGYPSNAPVVYAPIRSQNLLNRESKVVIVPEPTVTVTAVGNIVRSRDSENPDNVRWSIAGDTIRYPAGLTYGGNSGGPVFDMKGRVIGVLFAGGAGDSLAVPIKYGLELFPSGTAQ